MDERLPGRSNRALTTFFRVAAVCGTLNGSLESLARADATTSSASAAPSTPPTPAQLAEAKKFFEAGVKLMKEQLYQEALASFLEANKIAPRESIQNNIALSYRNLKDLASAYAAYEELLARYGDKMKPAARADAQRALEELAVLTGVITVKVQEPAAKVTLDGKDIGTTPVSKPLRANIGNHTVAISKAGFETLTKDVVIRGHDDVPVDGPLEKEILTGHINVTFVAGSMGKAQDSTAKIFVDGKDVGPAPWQSDLDPGIHTIEAKGNKSFAALRQIEVVKKGKYDVVLDLKMAEGTIAVHTGTPDDEITIDGKIVGRGAWEGTVTVGKHDLSVAKPGFVSYKTSMIVHLSERVAENVQLKPEGKSEEAGAPHDWTGEYGQMNLIGLFPVSTPSNDIAQGRDLTAGTTVKGSGGAGGGFDVRVGHSFGFIGIEGILQGVYDHSAAEIVYASGQSTAQHPGGPRTEDYDVHRFGGSGGVGVRFMPKVDTVRPVFAIGGGVSVKAAVYHRNATSALGNNGYSGDMTSYVAPMMIMDGGIELGRTPGSRFYLGAMLKLEFANGAQSGASSPPTSGVPAPTHPLDLANGTDVFFGPILGVQFGE